MINLSTSADISAVDNSKNSSYPKQSRGKVRLPPLSTRQLTRYIPQQEPTIQTGSERKPLIFPKPNLPSPVITENLLTPSSDYKCPRSPSNLSLQFNFEEPRHAGTNEPLEEKIDSVKAVSKLSGQKLVKSSVSKTPRNRRGIKMKSKGYHVLNNEECIALSEKPIENREKRGRKITGTSAVVKPQTDFRKDKMTKPRCPGAKSFTGSGLRVDTAKHKERKKSTYDLREFLSLPPDTQHRIHSVSPSLHKTHLVGHEKKPVKLSSKSKSSDDCTYNVFEFLALPVELTNGGQKKLKEKGAKSTKKPDIPSVIVADWSLSDDSPKTKQLIRQSRELPKANFPSNDFPISCQRHPTLQTPKTSDQRNSVYNLQEFLMLPEVARRHSGKRVNPQPQEAKPRSNSLEADSSKEPDVKYDLGEFLNFLESGGAGLQVNTTRERSVSGLRNRSLSVYDIYEFLKATNAKELSTGVEGGGEKKTSVLDVTTLVAKSSLSTNEENASQASSYNLREFLTLPATVESSENESRNSRSGTERLRIN